MGYRYWKGKNYKEGGLLVVGESFYSGELDVNQKVHDQQLCIKMINEVLDLSHVSKTHKNLQQLLAGEYIEKNEEFYDNISYHQLVQRPMNTIKERPKKQDYVEGFEHLFTNVIPELLPDKILFLGVGSVNNGLADFGRNREDIGITPVKCGQKIGRSYPRYLRLTVNKREVEMLWISHPGMAFNAMSWREGLMFNYPKFLIHKQKDTGMGNLTDYRLAMIRFQASLHGKDEKFIGEELNNLTYSLLSLVEMEMAPKNRKEIAKVKEILKDRRGDQSQPVFVEVDDLDA